MSRVTGWHSRETFGGTSLTSYRSGKRIAATDHCCAIVRTCPECFSRYVSTPEQPQHACTLSRSDEVRRGA